jgi:dienelactone hydrolase
MQAGPLALAALVAATALGRAGERNTGPWDMSRLRQAPAVERAGSEQGAERLYYTGEPFRGQPTRVYARYALPPGAGTAHRVPGIVLLHDRGEAAFADWAAYWAARGYAALAPDLFGNGPNGRLADGGPASDLAPVPDPSTHWVRALTNTPVADMWSYHAVAAAIRGVSLLASFPEVDGSRISVHGVGVGGHLAALVAGIDDRVRAAVPVFGAGHVSENSVWRGDFASLPCRLRQEWVAAFDPQTYLGQVTCPVLWVTGSNDPDFPLDTWQRSAAAGAASTTAVLPGLEHGPIWRVPGAGTAAEVFLDAALLGAPAAPHVGEVAVEGRLVTATFSSGAPVAVALLGYTFDTGRWQDRVWSDVPVTVKGNRIEAEIPEGPTVSWFLYVVDDRGAWASSPVAFSFEPGSPPQVVFDAAAVLPDGALRLSGRKPGGARFDLERTRDFCEWTAVGGDTSPGNAFEVVVPAAVTAPGPVHFRARRVDF